MPNPFLDVLVFHRVMGLPVGDFTRPAITDVELRLKLIKEELKELEDAIEANDIVAAADALADIGYVVNGAAVTWGIDLPPVHSEVHASNLTKRGGKRREDGKLLKPPGYRPPDLVKVLNASREYWLGKQSYWANRPDALVSSPVDVKLYLGVESRVGDSPLIYAPRYSLHKGD
jgi:hypothetical protein